MKKLLVFLSLVLLLTGCSASEAKFVGSRDTEDFHYDIETYETETHLMNDSSLVIQGLAGKPEEVTENFNGEILYASKIPVTVNEVLKGETNSKTIFVLQTGKPNSDKYETKLDEKKEYILFLNPKSFNGETVYDCTGIEQGIVEIKENGEMYSFADFGVAKTFDGKSVGSLKQQIEQVLTK